MVNKLGNIKVLIWDLDGTLYPMPKRGFLSFKRKLMKQLAGELNLTVKQAEQKFNRRVSQLKGTTKTLNSFNIDGFKMIGWVQESMPWDRLPRDSDKLNQLFNQLKQYRHILLTDNTAKAGYKKLDVLGLDPNIFEKKFFGIDLKLVKPDLGLFKEVLNYTELRPKQHFMIGDSIEKDILPAKKLNMVTCLVWSRSDQANVSLENVYQVKSLFK